VFLLRDSKQFIGLTPLPVQAERGTLIPLQHVPVNHQRGNGFRTSGQEEPLGKYQRSQRTFILCIMASLVRRSYSKFSELLLMIECGVKYEVTIGIPVFNVEKYIRDMMDSALKQTFPNIEYLICDDCGTDTSMDIVREYQNNHSRGKDIRIVRQPQNLGVGEARNRIVSEAKGDYLYFLDADDIISPNAIELLYMHAKKYDAEVVYGSYQRIEETDEHVSRTNICYPTIQFLKEYEFASRVYSEYGFLQGTTWNILICLKLFRKHQLRYKRINYLEDYTLTIDLPTYVNRAVMLSDITYFYYCRAGSLSNYHQRSCIKKDEIIATIKAIEEVKKGNYRLRDKPYFSKWMFKVMMTCFYIVCSILRNEKIITPIFPKREIRDVLCPVLTLSEVLGLREWRMKNLALYIWGVLPPSVSVAIIKIVGKWKGLVS
jgi:glycosyltransferase involved in cell wall biosynthesis